MSEPPHLADLRALVGQPGSRGRIPTPAAVLDLDAFERNVAKMQARADAARLALRPHAKSHKCAALARIQLDAGAVGVCCAKLAEAEALAAAGIRRILVTSPIVGEAPARRAARLAAELEDFRIVLDHVDGPAELGSAAAAPIGVLIDVDVGLGRTGVSNVEQAIEVARAIAAQPNLKLIGVQGYGGHWQHMEGANARASAVAGGMARLSAVVSALRDAGHTIGVVTGGGTGSFEADAAQGVLNEVQPGSYAFMDRQYRDALKADPDGAFEQALAIAATVISTNHPRWVTVDAGLKAFATDAGPPIPLGLDGAEYGFFGDEHGRLTRPGGRDLARGDRIDFVPPHVDPTLDRYEVIHLVRGDVLVDVARIEARGASQ
ncbi:alanine racemase [Phenylobacterium sp.]|jgi:D-serine deaminase-like pyridoxal phosphate-dependent protein|uniref:alanine racemase n=1 Tax=Phenylobacterium sp. TaxID=1871053 RepID=UPI002F91F7C9